MADGDVLNETVRRVSPEYVARSVEGIAAEIGRRTKEHFHGRLDEAARSKLATAVQAVAGEVLCDWVLGNLDVEVVHILHYGLPLCRFTTEVPSNWPPNAKWVALNDDKIVDQATCPRCKAQAEQEFSAAPR
jgi:hypothetical protein